MEKLTLTSEELYQLNSCVDNKESQFNHDKDLANAYLEVMNDFLQQSVNQNINQDAVSVIQRGIVLCVNNPSNGILITGINPSSGHRSGNGFYAFPKINNVGYWRHKRSLVQDEKDNVDNMNITAYLDLFPMRITSQRIFENIFGPYLQLKSNLLKLTQQEIEEHIKPKLIIIANKDSYYYWGVNSDATCMGYDLKKVKNNVLPERGDNVKIFKIAGFKEANDRVFQNPTTNLKDTIVVLYAMYDNRHKGKHLTAKEIKKIFENEKWELEP